MEKLLTDDDIFKLIGGKSKMVTYPELANYPTIESLFGRDNKVIILYVNTVNGNNISGHWVLLTRVKRNGKTIYEFMDSYGLKPDDQLKFYKKQWKVESGQDRNILTKLLYDCSLKNNCEVHYNELPIQKDSPKINTCGRWVGFRGHFYKVPLRVFQNLFNGLKKEGYDLDKLIVELTDLLNEELK